MALVTESSAISHQLSAPAARRELVFIDSIVYDQDLLLSGIASTIEVIVLDGERNGIEQISATLAERRDLDAVHFLSHGSERLLKLGNAWLSPETLDTYAEQIAGWRSALTAQADLLFYACDLGGSAAGQGLLSSLHDLTGADIAASSNNTGHAQHGADWILEYQLGTIEADPLLSQSVQDSWAGLLATVTVTNSTDVVNGNTGSIALLNANTGGDGISLREAVIAANNTAGTDSIVFNIFIFEGPLFSTIALGGQVDITGPVIIDGYTQPGASANSLAVGNNAVLLIELNGAGIFPEGTPPIINLTAGGSTIKGLVINRAPGSGIVLSGGDNNVIQGNFIGTDLGGTVDLGNAGAGITIAGSSIGNTIGGSSPGARNLISGNNQQGIDLAGGTSGNIIRGNYLGTNKGGTGALANSFEGVRISGSSNSNTIGGSGAGDRNVISGNLTDGVRINGSTGTLIQGNYIGTTATGTAALGNTNYGVLLQGGASGNTIGGLTSTPGTGAGNVLSGNGIDGVAMEHSGTANNQVQGNVIGLNAAGTASLGVQDFGVVLVDGPTNNTIGGTAAGARNVISGNEFDGVLIVRNTTAVSGNVVEGNYIGTDLGGTLDLGNGRYGVLLSGGVTNNRVGGTAVASRNVIAGNNQEGVRIESATSTGNLVQGNYIGTNAAGTGAVGNSGMGVLVLTATGNTIGGASAGAGNIISGNAGQGVLLSGGAASNAIQGNSIGTNAAGTGGLPNGFDGVVLSNAANNTIGGTTAGERNVISGNNSYGVTLADSGTTGNVVSGNSIGTNAAGTGAVGNGLGGVRVSLGASANTIRSNRLAFNGQDGVSIESGTGNRIQANEIFSNGGLGIDLSDNGVTANDAGDGDSGPNRLQNYPVLTSAVVNGTQVTIQGTLNSTASSAFVIEFFASASADSPSGFGEGQTFLGSATVTTNGSGNATINSTLTAPGVSGQFISATATHQGNNDTSEFALSILASTPPALDLDASGSGTDFSTTWTEDAGPKLLGDTDATITDADSANLQSLTVTLTNRPDGVVESLDANVAGTGITKTAYNSGTGVLLLSGSASIAQYQQVLRTVTYNNTSQAPTTTARTITFVASDGANSSNTATTTLTIVAVNDPPVNAVPGAQQTNEEQARVFSSGNGNLISIADVDAGTNAVQVTLTGTNGTVTLNGTSGLSFTVGDGTNDATMTFTGTIATINARLDGLSFQPTANFNGSATLQIVTNDQGNSGTGGAKNDTDQVSITVNAVNDAPSFTKGADQTVNEDAGAQTVAGWATNLSRGPADESGQTLTFLIQGNTNPGLFSAGPAISATGTLIYTPAANANGSATITVALQDNGGTASGGQNTSAGQSFVITVNPINDPPVLTNNGGGATAAISIPENSTAVTTLTSTDIDGGPPVYTIVGGVDQARFSLNQSTGVLTLLTAPDFEAPTDANADNVYDVTVQVNDKAGGVDQQAISVTVTNVANTLTVTTTADLVDGVTSSIEALNANPGTDGRISLREAILAANATPNGTTPDLILFNIPGTGVRTIQPTAALPALMDPVTIDGTTQPGYAGLPLIELTGPTNVPGLNGLVIGASGSGSTIRGLAINRFSTAGIRIESANGVRLEGNIIGTNAAGTSAEGNGVGVVIVDGPSSTIGGFPLAARNLISGNSGDGIQLLGGQSAGNQILGNFIGTDITGLIGIPNGGHGIFINGASDTLVGHPTVSGGANRIAFNAGAGVAVADGVENRVEGNIFTGNGGLDIDLGADGPTPNDPLDADGSPNHLQNYPVLTAAWQDGTVVQGTLDSTPSQTFTLEFFVKTGGSAGTTLLGRRAVTTNAAGVARFQFNLDTPVSLGDIVVATATDGLGNTSEISPGIAVTADGVATFPLTVTFTGDGTGTVTSLPAGIETAQNDFSELYPRNTLVTLTATPSPGSFFAGWAGYGVVERGTTLTVNIQEARTYTATFFTQPAMLQLFPRVHPIVKIVRALSPWKAALTFLWDPAEILPERELVGYNLYVDLKPPGKDTLPIFVEPTQTSKTLTKLPIVEHFFVVTSLTRPKPGPMAAHESGLASEASTLLPGVEESPRSLLGRGTPNAGIEGWEAVDEGRPAPSQWAARDEEFFQQFNQIGPVPASTLPDDSVIRRGTYLFKLGGIGGDRRDYDLDMLLRSPDVGALGIMFRYVDGNNFYRLSLEQGPQALRLIKVKDGRAFPVMVAITASYTQDGFNTISIGATGETLTVRAVNSNGQPIVSDIVINEPDLVFRGNGLALYSANNSGSVYDLAGIPRVENPDPNVVGLQVNATGIGRGTVQSTVNGQPAGLNSRGSPSASFNRGTAVLLTATPDPGYGFGGWYDVNGNPIPSDPNNPNTLTVTVDQATLVEARFVGSPPPSHTLDINGDGVITAATDGRLAQRFLGGVPDSQLTSGLLTTQATTPLRPTAAAARSYMETSTLTMLDVDGDGVLNPFTDGRLVFRFLQQRELNQTGPGADAALIQGAIGQNAQRRDAAAIRSFLTPYLSVTTQSAGAELPGVPSAVSASEISALSTQHSALGQVVPMGYAASLTFQSATLADGTDDQPLLSSSPAWLGDFVVSSAVLTEDPNRELAVVL